MDLVNPAGPHSLGIMAAERPEQSLRVIDLRHFATGVAS